jgi:F0F1-type ATP synthase delta subunit
MTLSRKIAATIKEKNIPVKDVIETLTEYKLLALLPTIKDALRELEGRNTEQGTIAIESPFPLSHDAEARIKRIVGNDLAETRVTINKELLAGFKARFKGKLYDGSAQRIINQLTT